MTGQVLRSKKPRAMARGSLLGNCFGGSIAGHDRRLSEQVEPVVHAQLDGLDPLPRVDIQEAGGRTGYRCYSLGAEIVMIEFGKDRPIRGDGVFEADDAILLATTIRHAGSERRRLMGVSGII